MYSLYVIINVSGQENPFLKYLKMFKPNIYFKLHIPFNITAPCHPTTANDVEIVTENNSCSLPRGLDKCPVLDCFCEKLREPVQSSRWDALF